MAEDPVRSAAWLAAQLVEEQARCEALRAALRQVAELTAEGAFDGCGCTVCRVHRIAVSELAR